MLMIVALLLAAPQARDRLPTVQAPPGSRAEGARATVRRYYQAIGRGDLRTAYRLWGDGGRPSGQSYASFVRGFAQTARSRVVADVPRDQEGAAGSIFITVPVDVFARLKNGRRQHFRGTYVLRRVNDIDGATAAQLGWHIERARLRQVG